MKEPEREGEGARELLQVSHGFKESWKEKDGVGRALECSPYLRRAWRLPSKTPWHHDLSSLCSGWPRHCPLSHWLGPLGERPSSTLHQQPTSEAPNLEAISRLRSLQQVLFWKIQGARPWGAPVQIHRNTKWLDSRPPRLCSQEPCRVSLVHCDQAPPRRCWHGLGGHQAQDTTSERYLQPEIYKEKRFSK